LLNDLATGSNGGNLFGLGTDLLWDTRDNIFFPNTGGYQYFKFMYHWGHDASGLDEYKYTSFEIDVRHFHAFKPDMVLAGQFYIMTVSDSGFAPFYRVPAIGGKTYLRGYYTGRYRDNFFMMMQVEYRHRFSKRFGFVVFAGIGDVAPKLTEFSFTYLKYSLGAGLRFMFNEEERVNLRADVGFGRKGNIGIYLGIEEAF
jgi:outer membrane protein assembly factor BamA